MHFSHLVLCDRREGQSSQARYEEQLAEVRLMDQLGYWACWFAEHHFAGYALVPDCLLMAAAAARETRRIRLGTGVVVLPFQHHPIRVVEQAAMVDCLSGGRLELGLGRGYQPHEFTGFGVKLEESQERFDQSLSVVRQALAQLHGLDYQTPLFQGRHASIYPKPVQNPIPCWGASISEASFARYGALGWPILTFPANQKPEALRAQIDTYRRVFREQGHDPARMRVALTLFCYLAESAAEANETFERGMERYFGFLDSITVHAEAQQHTLYDRIPTLARLSGSPEDAVERLRELIDYFEVTDVLNVTQFAGYLSHEQITRSMRLFADRVMPHFPRPRSGGGVIRPRERVSSGGRWEPLVGYSRAVRVGDTVWVSGCTAAGPGGAVVGPGDAYLQTAQAIRTMAAALEQLGLGLGHVVKTGVYLADMSQWEAVARAHCEAFGDVRPACTWVECGTMIHPDMLVEIDAIAVE